MGITTILFDLDGTLLPMNQDRFAGAYVKGLTIAAEPAGYSPMILSTAIIAGTAAMVKNDGKKTNEEVFWDTLERTYGESVKNDIHLFDEFYATDFQKIKDVCGFDPKAAKLIRHIKEKGFRVALATNPLFPSVATESRIRWAGLDRQDFELYTTYETSRYCKPNLDYYKAILNQLQVSPEECVMVGNDAHEDMIAEQLGMKVFLLTDCLINKNNADISRYPQGSFDELFAFIDRLER
ncbi:MAG: HAD family hydrolase [Clostridia bacterium]|nr:HAD family hydrolase [Clostridia bacterium]